MNNRQAKQIKISHSSKSKKAEQVLQQSELELSVIYDLAPVVMFVVDEDRRVVKSNRATLEFTGRAEHEMIGLRGGEAIRCLNSLDDPRGCGYGPLCVSCVVRNTTLDTLGTGISHHNIEAELPIAAGEGEKTLSFLLSTTRLNLPDAKRVVVCIQDITERKHIEDNIKHRLKIEQAIASVSRLFTSQTDVDINEVLKILGEVVSANRAYVFRMRDTGEIADNTHEWCSPGIEPQIQNLQGLDQAIFPWWTKKIRAGENIVIPDVDALPAEAAIEKEVLQAQAILSVLVVPIYRLDGTLAGSIGFDDTEDCRQWSDEDISLLRVAAEILSNYWERKQKVEELRDTESRYKTVLDTASRAGVGIAVVQDKDNKQGKLVFVNEECARISGYTEEELLDMTFDEVLPQNMLPLLMDNYVLRQSGEMVIPLYEAAFLTKSGDETPIEFSVDVTSYDGNLATIAFIKDITERKRMEEELTQQSTVLSMIMENTGTLLVYFDRNFNFIMANKAYIDISGYTWEELKGKNHFSFFPSEDNEAIFRKARDTGEAFSRNDIPAKFHSQPSRGITYWDSTLVPVKDDKGRVTGIVLSLTETTERKKMEQMKDEFIALVSHELRTPITVISGSLQLTKDQKLSIEEKQELIQNAIESTGDLFDILENMLELSRHRTGRLQLNTERININRIINDIVGKFKNAGVRQRFYLEIPEVLPLINADPLRIERILHNLIENAVKYSPADSEIKITVQSSTDFLVTSVIDHGKGIQEGIKHKLFQMFERGDDHGMMGGTGLGLVVCKRLVEEHGGWIEAESEPGQGATFSFGLPLRTQP